MQNRLPLKVEEAIIGYNPLWHLMIRKRNLKRAAEVYNGVLTDEEAELIRIAPIEMISKEISLDTLRSYKARESLKRELEANVGGEITSRDVDYILDFVYPRRK